MNSNLVKPTTATESLKQQCYYQWYNGHVSVLYTTEVMKRYEVKLLISGSSMVFLFYYDKFNVNLHKKVEYYKDLFIRWKWVLRTRLKNDKCASMEVVYQRYHWHEHEMRFSLCMMCIALCIATYYYHFNIRLLSICLSWNEQRRLPTHYVLLTYTQT